VPHCRSQRAPGSSRPRALPPLRSRSSRRRGGYVSTAGQAGGPTPTDKGWRLLSAHWTACSVWKCDDTAVCAINPKRLVPPVLCGLSAPGDVSDSVDVVAWKTLACSFGSEPCSPGRSGVRSALFASAGTLGVPVDEAAYREEELRARVRGYSAVKATPRAPKDGLVADDSARDPARHHGERIGMRGSDPSAVCHPARRRLSAGQHSETCCWNQQRARPPCRSNRVVGTPPSVTRSARQAYETDLSPVPASVPAAGSRQSRALTALGPAPPRASVCLARDSASTDVVGPYAPRQVRRTLSGRSASPSRGHR
jgi:hypothetical protein